MFLIYVSLSLSITIGGHTHNNGLLNSNIHALSTPIEPVVVHVFLSNVENHITPMPMPDDSQLFLTVSQAWII
jgi:hypothetical protein